MNVVFSVAEAHDSDTPSELRGLATVPAIVAGGFSTVFTGNGDYRWERSRVQLGATGASAVRYYNELGEVRNVSHTGGVGLNAALGPRTSVLVNGTAAYSPSYLYSLFPQDSATSPGDAIPTAPDYALDDFASYSYATTVTLTRGLTRRSSVSAGGDLQYTDFEDDRGRSGPADMRTRVFRGEYSRNLAPNTAMRVGYRYHTGTFASGIGGASASAAASTSEHGIDVGLNYSRPLSGTRRVVFGATIGSSALDTPAVVLAELSGEGMERGRVYRASTDLSLGYELKRWQVSGMFQRGLEYVAQLRQPVFIQGFSARIAALLSPRLDVRASGRYSSGASALSRDALTLDTYTADIRIRYALTQALAAYSEYLYYYYDLQGQRQFVPGIPSGLERNGVRAGLTLFVPALRR